MAKQTTTIVYPDDVARIETTKRPSRADLEKLAAELCDHACAAEERGNEELADALNRAIDALEALSGGTLVVADDPARGFGSN